MKVESGNMTIQELTQKVREWQATHEWAKFTDEEVMEIVNAAHMEIMRRTQEDDWE